MKRAKNPKKVYVVSIRVSKNKGEYVFVDTLKQLKAYQIEMDKRGIEYCTLVG